MLPVISEAHDPETQSMLKALRYWIAVPEGGARGYS